MKPLERLGIAGVGLIGGSLALALRRAGLVREVVGWGRTQRNLDVALERGILDRAGVTPDVLEGADALLLATPVATLAPAAREAASRLSPGAAIFDVGSVKQGVVDDCMAALGARAPHFVGCHPIAGNEHSGAAHADPDLLRGAPCVLTPVASTDPATLARVRRLWEAAGMRVVEMPPDGHDEWLAVLSHLPHIVAFALTSLVAGDGGTRPEAVALAGPSFRGATRVAVSSPEMWRDILLANRSAVAATLDRFRAALGEIGAAMERGDGDALVDLVASAGARRRALDGADPGASADEVRIEAVRTGLRGTVEVPGDKSIGHRGLLFGAIAEGVTTVIGLGEGEDNASTVRVLRGLGVRIERDGRTARVHGRGFAGLRAPACVLDCGNSGTTMRLVAGILAGRPFTSRLDGDASLRRRPMRRISEPLSRFGARIETGESGRPPVEVTGGALRGTRIDLEIASAQVKTSVLLAGLQAEGRTTVREPGLSRDHTERLLPAFGVRIERPEPLTVTLDGPQSLRACEVRVPGDPSAAAFWIVAASIVPGSRLLLSGVSVNPTRTGAIDVLRAMGASITETLRPPLGDEPVADLLVESRPLVGRDIGGDEMLRAIDEFPVLAVAAAGASGTSRFRDGAELRAKETDRIAAMVEGLDRLGVHVGERPDGLDVTGGPIGGGEVESQGDHRIAMAFVVAGLVASAPVVVRGAGAISVSDPGFLATLARLRTGAA